jgi:diguanylate cyclase (GGDEF)-like protein/PAS domain S-box-containing protein
VKPLSQAWQAALTLWLLLMSSVVVAEEPIRLGVLSYEGGSHAELRWSALADYLSATLDDRPVSLSMLAPDEIMGRVESGQLDLLLTSPMHYVQLRARYPLSGALATLVLRHGQDALRGLGATIIVRRDNASITHLRDLRGGRIASLGADRLSGYTAPAISLEEAGIPATSVNWVTYSGGDEAIFAAVLTGEVDAGTLRSGALEYFSQRGMSDLDTLKVLNAQDLPGYPLAVSTRLYPEWSFIALSHVEEQNARRIAAALLMISPDSNIARAIGIAGFTIPADYEPVENALRTLRLYPFDHAPDASLLDFLRRYRLTVIAALLVTLALAALSAGLLLNNRKLRGLRLREKRYLQTLMRNRDELAQLARVFESAQEGISITDPDGRILNVNPALCKMTGYDRNELIGHSHSVLSSGRHDRSFYESMWSQLKSHGSWRGEIWNRRKNGDLFVELLTISALKDDQGAVTQYLGLFSDITELKRKESALQHLAHFDPLTGLPNRVLLSDRLNRAILHSQRKHKLLAVCFIDLDGFKAVNDAYGHELGDILLIEVARRLRNAVRAEDTVSRLGGDEFIVLLGDLESISECEQVLKRIHQDLSEPYQLQKHSASIGASSGVVIYPTVDDDADALIRFADQAMYQAKQAGRNRFEFFNPEYGASTAITASKTLQAEEGLSAGQFSLFYQPLVDLQAGEVVGVEALLRWQHPQQGLLCPMQFLNELYGTPFELTLGDWVIAEALQQADQWRAQGLKLRVSVNISARHLQSKDFVEHLMYRLSEHPELPRGTLQLEVLESSTLSDLAKVTQVLEECRNELGVRVALDDFGTSNSSLSHLRHLPTDIIKIDRSFIGDMFDHADDFLLVGAILKLAQAFGRGVVAEGVESPELALLLLSLGCHQAQGYGIGRPMPPDQLTAWLRNFQIDPRCTDWTADPGTREGVFFGLIHYYCRRRFEMLHQWLSQPAVDRNHPNKDGHPQLLKLLIEINSEARHHAPDIDDLLSVDSELNSWLYVADEVLTNAQSLDETELAQQLNELERRTMQILARLPRQGESSPLAPSKGTMNL